MDVAPGTVVVYSDIGCPWGSLAVHRLRKQRHKRGLDGAVRIDHRAYPLELLNARLTPKNTVESEVAVIGSHEQSLGWQPWRGHERHYPSTTLLAMEAVQAAKADPVGGLRASEDLDAALRDAWYAQSRSIHLYAEILDVAASCPSVDEEALGAALKSGQARGDVFAQWEVAQTDAVQGSPHLFLADGFDVHSPGITLSWTGGEPARLPVIEHDDPSVYDEILDRAGRHRPS